MVPVPSVATKESTCATSTSTPLTRPTKPAQATTSRIASGQGRPYLTWRLIARMCHITMPKPTVRSMRPAIIGSVAASDSRAMIALSARIERTFRTGRERVRQQDQEKKTIEQQREDRQAVDRQQAHRSPASAIRPASSARVGSSAFDLMDCMAAPPEAEPGTASAGSSGCSRTRQRAGCSTDRSSAASSARRGPRSKTSARWQTLATSSKSVETMRIAAPAWSATSNRR